MSKVRNKLRMLWEYLREVAGENDYLRYRNNTLARGEEPLSPQEFYTIPFPRMLYRLAP